MLTTTAEAREAHTVTEPDGGVWTTWYDFAGRAVAEERPDGTGLERQFEGTRLTEVRHLDGAAVLAREGWTYDTLGHAEQRWGPVDEAKLSAQSYTLAYDDYQVWYSTTPEGRTETVTGANDETAYTWTDGVLTGETISGVTDIVYGYDADYPRQTTATIGGDRVITRSWTRGLWLDTEQFDQGTQRLVRSFGDWDAYGQPGYAEATLDGVQQRLETYTTRTSAAG